MLAEEMLVLAGVEQVTRQLGFSREQSEPFRSGYRHPEAVAAADGAIAAERRLREIEIGFESDGAAVAAAVVGSKRHAFPFVFS